MVENLRDTLLASIKTNSSAVQAEAEKESQSEDVTSAENEADEKTDAGEKEETKELEGHEEEKKTKKHSFQGRIDTLTARNKQFEEQLAKVQAENESIKAQLNKSQTTQEKKEPEKVSFSTVEELEDYLNKVVTKDDISEIVQKLLDDRLSKAKESIEKAEVEKTVKQVRNEFSSKMEEFYKVRTEEEFAELDDSKKAEAMEILELFESNPRYYLEKVNKFGMGWLKKLVSGELEAEKKADKIKTVIDKAKAVRTNTDGSENVRLSDEELKGKSLRDILKDVIKKR